MRWLDPHFSFVTPTKVGVQPGDAKQKLESGFRRKVDED